MINKKQTRKIDYSNASKLLDSLIDADNKVEQQIKNYIQHYGETNLFSKLDTLRMIKISRVLCYLLFQNFQI